MARAKITETGSPKQLARAFGPSARAAALSAVTHWHGQMMPGHFANDAKSRYQYQPRTKKYEIRKARKYGHRRPLVYSGDSERAAKSQVRLTSRTVRNQQIIRAVATMTLPKYFYMYNKMHNAPDKAA